MNEEDREKVVYREDLTEKLMKIRTLSLELAREDIPQLQNNMELVLSLINELLFLFDDKFERP